MSEIIFSTSGKCFSPYRREVRAPDKMSCSEKSNTGSYVAAAKQEEKIYRKLFSVITVINLPAHSIAALPVFTKKESPFREVEKNKSRINRFIPDLFFHKSCYARPV